MVDQGKLSIWIILKTIDFGKKFRNRLILISKGTHNSNERHLSVKLLTLLQDERILNFYILNCCISSELFPG
jgi:hypothetical protein